MSNPEPMNVDFEFDCPQFTDFTANLDNVSEEFCQNYFDKKAEEIKRNSNEFNKENMENHMKSELNDKENTNPEMSPEAPMNLLSTTDFANTSSISTKSSASCKHYPTHSALNNMKNNKHKSNQLTTEEMQLIEMQQKKIELERLKEKNAKNVAKMKDEHRVFHPSRSTKLTIPITPALRTTIRARQRMKQRKVSETNQDSKKRKASYTATTTVPQSFKLSKTKKRRTASATLSSEEKELKEIQKHTFHARKLNPKLFQPNAANIGILNNIKNKANTTTVQPFNLLTEKRAQKHTHAQKQ